MYIGNCLLNGLKKVLFVVAILLTKKIYSIALVPHCQPPNPAYTYARIVSSGQLASSMFVRVAFAPPRDGLQLRIEGNFLTCRRRAKHARMSRRRRRHCYTDP